MKRMLCAVLVVACFAAASCDASTVLNLPRAKSGARCAVPGAFARDNGNVLQCSKKKRWVVNMSIARAISLIDAYNQSRVTTTTTTSPPPTTTTPPPPPTTPPTPPTYPLWVAAGGDSTCWGISNGSVYCAGRNDHGQLGIGSTLPVTAGFVQLPAGYSMAPPTIGADHACASVGRANVVATVWCWGRNDRGQLGDGTTTDRSVPTPTLGAIVGQTISAGFDHTCATPNDALVQAIWCWGANDHGQLGSGSIGGQSLTPVQVSWPVFEGPKEVHLGDGFSCASSSANGAMYCWGRNNRGQVGDGTTVDRAAPTLVSGVSTSFRFGSGRAHTCATVTAFQIACWGDNSDGQFGDGTTPITPQPTPVLVSPNLGGRMVFSLDAGGDRTCIIGEPNWCAGDNSFGQIDPDDPTGQIATFRFADLGEFTSTTSMFHFALGWLHTCAISEPPAWTGALPDGACWGDDFFGQSSG